MKKRFILTFDDFDKKINKERKGSKDLDKVPEARPISEYFKNLAERKKLFGGT